MANPTGGVAVSVAVFCAGMSLMVGGVLAVFPPAIDAPILDLTTAVSAPLIAPLPPTSQRKFEPSTVAPTAALTIFTSAPVTDPVALTSPSSVRNVTAADGG